MALISKPSDLVLGTDIVVDTTNKLITIKKYNASSNTNGKITNDGVTMQAVYSFLMDLWKNNDDYISHLFPIYAVYTTSFEFIYGWKLANATSISLIRQGGFAYINDDNQITEEYMAVGSLGVIPDNANPYYQTSTNGSAIECSFTGKVDEPVKIFGDADNGDVSNKTYFKLYVRDFGKTYSSASTIDNEISYLTYNIYQFAINSEEDLKISDDFDETMEPYNDITITYHDTPVVRTINNVDYNFNIIIDGNNASLQQIYEMHNYLMSLNVNINSSDTTDARIGKISELLVNFVGNDLHGTQGVFIDNYPTNEVQQMYLKDNDGTAVVFPQLSQIRLTDLYVGTDVCIYKCDSNGNAIEDTPLSHVNKSTTLYTYDFTFTEVFYVNITLIHPDYKVIEYLATKIEGNYTNKPIYLKDRVYDNPDDI